MHDGSQITYRYNEPMKYLECMQYADNEAKRAKQQDTGDMKRVDYYCGTNKNFIDEYLK